MNTTRDAIAVVINTLDVVSAAQGEFVHVPPGGVRVSAFLLHASGACRVHGARVSYV
jgi:hypothetical protein